MKYKSHTLRRDLMNRDQEKEQRIKPLTFMLSRPIYSVFTSVSSRNYRETKYGFQEVVHS